MIDSSFNNYAHGKLLLTGEYFVLDGANALALPTTLGQRFSVDELDGPNGRIDWISLDRQGKAWFNGQFFWNESFEIVSSTEELTAARLCQLLNAAAILNPDIKECKAVQISTTLEFSRSWGLGSSSTLVHCMAQWLRIDPYRLLKETFGGSGYDLACANANGPVFYQRSAEGAIILPTILDWPFKDQLYFVFLEKKQDSREGIQHYNNCSVQDKSEIIARLSAIGQQLPGVADLKTFCTLIDHHEEIVASTLNMAKGKDLYFEDFRGSIKSLGAWGGDFILAASEMGFDLIREYFTAKGYSTIIKWNDLILEPSTPKDNL